MFNGRTIVFIEHPRTWPAQNLLRRLAELDARVVLVTAGDGRSLQAVPGIDFEPREHIAALVEVEHITTRAVVTALKQAGERPDVVLALSHYLCETAARVARDLGLEHVRPESVALAVHKGRLREVLAGKQYSVEAAVVSDVQELEAAVRLLGLPVVVKPTGECSSVNVFRADTLEDARLGFDEITSSPVNYRGFAQAPEVLVEQFIAGPEFSVETLTDGTGHTYIYGVTAKTHFAAAAEIEVAQTFPAPLSQEHAESLASAATDALRVIGHRGPAHTEIRLSPSGPRIIEVNPRPAGGLITTMVEDVTGRDIYVDTICDALNIAPQQQDPSTPAACWWHLHADQSGRVSSVNGVGAAQARPGARFVHLYRGVGDHVQGIAGARDARDRIGSLLVHGQSPGAALRHAREMADLVTFDMD